MKSILNKVFKRNHQKKKKYLMHYQLVEHVENGNKMLMKMNLFLFIGTYIYYHDYPLFLATLDFTFTICVLLFLLVIKPQMLIGVIPGYYRRDYKKIKTSLLLMKIFIQGSCIRFAILAFYYLITFYLVRDNPVEIARYKEMALEIIVNPSVSLIAILSFALSIYQIFYRERYISIRDYSNTVVEIYNRYPYSEEEAVNQFIRQRDNELELVNLNDVKYNRDYVLSSTASTSSFENNQVFADKNVNEEGISLNVIEVENEMVRRKARR